MKLKLIIPLAFLLIAGCAPKAVQYDLPSAGVTEKPNWVETQPEVRDTIFIVIQLPEEHSLDMDQSVQQAQSELNTLLMSELEIMLRDYWAEKRSRYSEDEKFELIAGLPGTLEKIMHYVAVTDGWERNGEVSILCAIDYEQAAKILMSDMKIRDRSFLSYLKRRMDALSQRYR